MSTHNWRHSFASRALALGETLSVVGELRGHTLAAPLSGRFSAITCWGRCRLRGSLSVLGGHCIQPGCEMGHLYRVCRCACFRRISATWQNSHSHA